MANGKSKAKVRLVKDEPEISYLKPSRSQQAGPVQSKAPPISQELNSCWAHCRTKHRAG